MFIFIKSVSVLLAILGIGLGYALARDDKVAASDCPSTTQYFADLAGGSTAVLTFESRKRSPLGFDRSKLDPVTSANTTDPQQVSDVYRVELKPEGGKYTVITRWTNVWIDGHGPVGVPVFPPRRVLAFSIKDGYAEIIYTQDNCISGTVIDPSGHDSPGTVDARRILPTREYSKDNSSEYKAAVDGDTVHGVVHVSITDPDKNVKRFELVAKDGVTKWSAKTD
jgi:hypothetical protein